MSIARHRGPLRIGEEGNVSLHIPKFLVLLPNVFISEICASIPSISDYTEGLSQDSV